MGLIAKIAGLNTKSVVDLGCGRGELALLFAQQMPNARVVGLDTDEDLIQRAQAAALASGLDNRVTFELSDATTNQHKTGAAFCIGASHMFGGLEQTLQALKSAGHELLLIGDGFWQSEPSEWCRETFGELPAGMNQLRKVATDTGWCVVHSDKSSLEEWDHLEQGWTAAVRSVGTPEATAFADKREEEYQTKYRGVLGFGWLVVTQATAS